MRRSWVRVACLALLGLIAGAALSGVAKASAPGAHACCADAAPEQAAPDASACRGFLPLSCCHAPALPGGEPGPQALAGAPCVATAISSPPVVRIARADHPPAPALPPARLSVVLQL